MAPKAKQSAKEFLATQEVPEIINGIDNPVTFAPPYSAHIEIEGNCPLIFHKYNVEEVASKKAAKKGSKEKNSDNVESFIYRDVDNHICLPGEYLRMALVYASKFKQDPRSPRKSAMDLFKAGLFPLTDLAKVNGGTKVWDFIDQRRVVVQRNAISRMRPAFLKGWTAEIEMSVILPEYIDRHLFREVLEMAGRLIGVGDFRPTYGRFSITTCRIEQL